MNRLTPRCLASLHHIICPQMDLTGGTEDRMWKTRGSTHYPRWINRLEGLSDEPMRRAAQIALAAIDETLSNGQGH